MKQLLRTLFLAGCSVTAAFAQTPNVSKFTKVDVNILAVPERGTVVPTSDGGYFMSKGLKLTKYDANNSELWSQTLTGTSKVGHTHKITSICEDGQGGAIITGQVHGTLSNGTDSLPAFVAAGSSGFYSGDAFIARISQTGKLWWHRFGEYTLDAPDTDKGIAVRMINNKVYWLAHGKARNLKFNNVNYPLSQYPGNLGLLCQFALDGTIDWVNVSKGGGSIPANLVVVNNSILYTGYSLGSSTAIDFGNSKKINYNQASFFAVKYDNTGMAQWAVTYDDDNLFSNLHAATADDEGNLYVCGGGSNFSTSYGIRKASGYLIKIKGTDGSHAWTRVFSGLMLKGPEFSNGKIYVAGNVTDTRYLQTGANDSIQLKASTPTVGSEQFIATFDKSGTLSGSLKAVGGLAGGTMEYLQSTSNRVIVVGTYSNSNVFGNTSIPSSGGNVGAYHIGFFDILTGSGPSGIADQGVEVLKSLYPNPARHSVTVETTDHATITSIIVMDMSGKKVLSNTGTHTGLAEINVSTLGRGLYLLEVNTSKGAAFSKLIIE